jgi:rhodanese-related sulfurtransferase
MNLPLEQHTHEWRGCRRRHCASPSRRRVHIRCDLACAVLASMLLLGPLAAWAQAGHASAPAVRSLDNGDLQRMVEEGVTVVDIRRPEEWRQTGVIGGSYLVTAFDSQGRLTQEFGALFSKLADPRKPVVLICRTGNRTDILARLLVEQAGYQQVYNVTHGITSWIASGGEVEPCEGRGPDLRC